MEYGTDYFAGWDMFEYSACNIISEAIDMIEKIGSPKSSSCFVPSHTWKVIDDRMGIEAAEGGVRYFELSKYFDNPGCEIVSCRPADITYDTEKQMLKMARQIVDQKTGYDYLGLIGDVVEGMIGIDRMIPELHKIANPLHSSHNMFCSAVVAALNKSTAQYQNIDLFTNFTISKISPLMLYTAFPYDVKISVKKVGNERKR